MYHLDVVLYESKFFSHCIECILEIMESMKRRDTKLYLEHNRLYKDLYGRKSYAYLWFKNDKLLKGQDWLSWYQSEHFTSFRQFYVPVSTCRVYEYSYLLNASTDFYFVVCVCTNTDSGSGLLDIFRFCISGLNDKNVSGCILLSLLYFICGVYVPISSTNLLKTFWAVFNIHVEKLFCSQGIDYPFCTT